MNKENIDSRISTINTKIGKVKFFRNIFALCAMGSVLGTAFVATREPSASKYAMLGISSICTGLSSTLYCFKLAESNELKDEREEYLKKKSRTMK